MTDPNKTAIAVILDASGSMGTRVSDVVVGFQTFIEEQRRVPGECTVTLTRFNEKATVDYTDKPLGQVPLPLEYRPWGGTALFDAVGTTIDQLGGRLAGMPEAKRPGKVIVLIITDGEENSSKEYTEQRVKDMIKHQTDKYGWVFNFMGCGLEAMKGAGQLGISSSNAAMFSGGNAHVAFANYATKTSLTRGLQTNDAQVIAASMSYSAEDRAALVTEGGK